MKKRIDNGTKEQIIKTTIWLIDSQGGASDVNLREIARIVGCSAPNIYNYFESLDDLLNTALVRICDDFKINILEKTAKIGNTDDLLNIAFQSYIEYALDYTGRLNFYHFERLSFVISPEAEASAESVGQNMAHLLDLGTNHKLSSDKLMDICSIIHCFLIGKLSEYITGRRQIDNRDIFVKELVILCKHIFECLS